MSLFSCLGILFMLLTPFVIGAIIDYGIGVLLNCLDLGWLWPYVSILFTICWFYFCFIAFSAGQNEGKIIPSFEGLLKRHKLVIYYLNPVHWRELKKKNSTLGWMIVIVLILTHGIYLGFIAKGNEGKSLFDLWWEMHKKYTPKQELTQLEIDEIMKKAPLYKMQQQNKREIDSLEKVHRRNQENVNRQMREYERRKHNKTNYYDDNENGYDDENDNVFSKGEDDPGEEEFYDYRE